jgi:hypothetical protein
MLFRAVALQKLHFGVIAPQIQIVAATDYILKQVEALFCMQHSIFLPGKDFGLGRNLLVRNHSL